MTVKKIELILRDYAVNTVVQLESNNEQGVVHFTLRDKNSVFEDVCVVGVVLTCDKLEEIYFAIGDVLEHQRRAEKRECESS